MNGLVVKKSDRLIATVVSDVVKVVGNNIVGKAGAAEEINLDEADIFVVDSEYEAGDKLPAGTKNHVLAFTEPTEAEKKAEDEQRIMDLELALAALLSTGGV